MTEGSARRYFPGLHFIRAYAALSVVAYHSYSVRYWFDVPIVEYPFQGILLDGMRAVSLFFGLSSFLITYQLLEDQAGAGIRLKRFYARRARRILPLYFLVALVSVVVVNVLLVSAVRVPLAEVLAVLSMSYQVALYGQWITHALFGHYWSIAAEEHMYLLSPFLLRTVRRVPLVAGILLALVAVIKTFPDESGRALTAWIDGTLLQTFAVGMLGAWVVFHNKPALQSVYRLERPLLLTVGAVILFGYGLAGTVLSPLLDILGVAVMVLVARKPRPLLDHPIIRWVGDRSFGVYMWHVLSYYVMAVVWLRLGVQRLDGVMFAPFLVATYALTVGLAALSYRYLEAPLLGRRRRTALDAVALARG